MSVPMKFLLGVAALMLVAAPGRPSSAACTAKAGDCTMKVTEDGLYCPKCDKLVEKGDVDKDTHKGDCKTKVVKVKVCVKKCYECYKGDKTSDKPGS